MTCFSFPILTLGSLRTGTGLVALRIPKLGNFRSESDSILVFLTDAQPRTKRLLLGSQTGMERVALQLSRLGTSELIIFPLDPIRS